jgi:FkbM family methyltransferase
VIEAPVGTARYWLCLTVLVSRLGATRADRLKLFVLGALTPLRDLFLEPKARRVTLKLDGREFAWWVGPKSDLFILNEILLCNEYGRFDPPRPNVVLDLGSHIGVSLLHWRLRYPETKLIGIEPNPVTFARLRRNAAQLPADVHQFAIADYDGQVEFYAARQACTSSLVPVDGSESVTVEARTLDTLIDELGLGSVDLLKIDIEDGELQALQNSRHLRNVPVVIGEFSDHGSASAREAFFSLFHDCALDIHGDLGEHTTFMAVRKVAPVERGD